ncbi:MAG: radical SAM protein [Parvimonas sp.]|uniref:elongator complex protein 3 n=1 Tax=Parvimonas sp. TaxID=1944660 RepID=UPI001CAD3D9E|nr:radical SAM protein [Parvimonas sp.]MBF1294923.1 radical SAM protein [Parvimonas sp.]
MNKCNIIPIFVPHMGCPHDCIFCNQRKITNFIDVLDEVDIRKNIENYISYFKNKNIPIEIAFYGGSFTGLDKNLMIRYLEIAKYYIDRDYVNSIRISTRPDYISKEILDILIKYKVHTIELGVQSMTQSTLDLNNRGHNVECVYESSSLIKKYNIKLGLQMMVGLYGDTIDTVVNTAFEICKINPDFVRVYPTLTIKDTELERLYYSKEYIPMSLEDSICLCKYIYVIFKYYNIPIIRLGLQSSDNISEDVDIVAGPYHPAFRELVESSVYRDFIEYYMCFFDIKDDITIKCNNSEVSKIVGNKRSNLKYFKEKYNINIKIKTLTLEKNILKFNENIVYMNDFIDYYFNKNILRRINET